MDEITKIVCVVLNITEHDLIYERKFHAERSLFCLAAHFNGISQREIAYKLNQSVPSIHYQVEKAIKNKDEQFVANKNRIEELHAEYLRKLQEAKNEIINQILN